MDTKLFITCFRRNGSTLCMLDWPSGISILNVSATPLLAAMGWNTSTTSSTSSYRFVGFGNNWNLPASILERSSRSSIRANSDLAA
ncbi:hypothetical protein D3C87_1604680 [compost metagenome]